MRGVAAVGAALVLVAALAVPAGAGEGRWTGRGPYGGTPGAVTTHPTNSAVALSGSHGAGVFRSGDGGRTWVRSSSGLPPDTLVFDIVYAPSNPSIVYAATYADGVFRSNDGGRTWAQPERRFGTVETVAVSPVNANVVWAGTGSETYHSTDGGQTWTETRLPPDNSLWASVITFAPSNPNVLYAAGSNFYYSTNGGATWTEGAAPPHIEAVAVHPTNPSVLYVGSGEGVHKSVDGGKTFNRVLQLPVLDIATAIVIDQSRPSVVYVGSYYSGVYKLTSGGAESRTWDRGLPRERMTSMAMSADATRLLAGVGHHGIYRRGVSAEQWEVSRTGFRGSGITELATPPSGGSVIYAGVHMQGVARSADGGESWHWRGLRGRVVRGLAVHPKDSSRVYAAAGGLFKTNDGGRNWRRLKYVENDGFVDVVISPSSPNVVYATTFEGGTFRSGNAGDTWHKLSLPGYYSVVSLAVHPRRPSTVYAGTRSQAVVKSTDGGKTWKAGTGLPTHFDPLDIAIDPKDPSRVTTAIESAGVYRSTNGGSTWRPAWRGTEPQSASAVVIDQRRPWRMFAAGYGFDRPGVFRSTDRGRSWELMVRGLTTRWTNDLALSAAGTKLYAGTTTYALESGGGVFSYRFR